MKPYRKIIVACFSIALLLFSASCGAPQRYWPQEDIIESETARPVGSQVVLTASRSSDFKELLVAKLHEQLHAVGLAQKTIGVEGLAQVDSTNYAAVVIINTCLAWGFDHDVQTFLDRQETNENIIVLTTSSNGAWLPDKGEKDFDAISAASEMTSVDTVARNIMAGIQSRLQHEKPKPTH